MTDKFEHCSDFVARCQAALAKCQELTFMGMSRELAVVQSGLRDAVCGKPERPTFDARAAAANDQEESV